MSLRQLIKSTRSRGRGWFKHSDTDTQLGISIFLINDFLENHKLSDFVNTDFSLISV